MITISAFSLFVFLIAFFIPELLMIPIIFAWALIEIVWETIMGTGKE